MNMNIWEEGKVYVCVSVNDISRRKARAHNLLKGMGQEREKEG